MLLLPSLLVLLLVASCSAVDKAANNTSVTPLKIAPNVAKIKKTNNSQDWTMEDPELADTDQDVDTLLDSRDASRVASPNRAADQPNLMDLDDADDQSDPNPRYYYRRIIHHRRVYAPGRYNWDENQDNDAASPAVKERTSGDPERKNLDSGSAYRLDGLDSDTDDSTDKKPEAHPWRVSPMLQQLHKQKEEEARRIKMNQVNQDEDVDDVAEERGVPGGRKPQIPIPRDEDHSDARAMTLPQGLTMKLLSQSGGDSNTDSLPPRGKKILLRVPHRLFIKLVRMTQVLPDNTENPASVDQRPEGEEESSSGKRVMLRIPHSLFTRFLKRHRASKYGGDFDEDMLVT